MKSVLISIQPKWCELIASGKKTVEVRKTRPKLETPFKVYIYRTKGFVRHLLNDQWWDMPVGGNVIGEFVCDRIERDDLYTTEVCGEYWKETTCLTQKELIQYGDYNPLYFWHISDLVIYDKPKSLSEFQLACDREKCGKCKRSIMHKLSCNAGLTRPPQSWFYVESEG